MFSIQSNFLLATLLNIFVNVKSLVKLQSNEDFEIVTLKKYVNLQEIELLSQVNHVDNDTYFIAQINGVLDEDDDSEVLTESDYAEAYVETLIEKLRYLKDNYNLHDNLRKEGRRVYRGISVYNIKKFPFMASIHSFNKYRCGGSIISRDFIITSSACLKHLGKKESLLYSNPDFLSFVSVRVGSKYTSKGGKTFDVYAIYFHPNFNLITLENNIGLIRLRQQITFSSKIDKIDLDSEGIPTDIGDRITVIGWGAKDRSYVKSRLLLYSKLDYYPLRYCKKVYSTTNVKNYYFCAGFVHKNGGACNYDMGAPGIVNGELAGIINFGPVTCGKRNSPTVFTKVAYYSDWIKDIMGQDPKFLNQSHTTINNTSMISNIPESMKLIPI